MEWGWGRPATLLQPEEGPTQGSHLTHDSLLLLFCQAHFAVMLSLLLCILNAVGQE